MTRTENFDLAKPELGDSYGDFISDVFSGNMDTLDEAVYRNTSDISTLRGQVSSAQSGASGAMSQAQANARKITALETSVSDVTTATALNTASISNHDRYLNRVEKTVIGRFHGSNLNDRDDNPTRARSDLFEIEGVVTLSTDDDFLIALYQLNKNTNEAQLINNHGQNPLTHTFSSDYKYRLMVYNKDDASANVPYAPNITFEWETSVLSGVKNLRGKKINCLGDSFTAPGYSWAKHLADRTGAVCNNYGVASSRIAIDVVKNNETIGSFLSRYNDMDASADMTIIFGGINDAQSIYSGALALGDMNSPINNSTFYGAVKLLVENLKSHMPGKKIFGVIPPDFQPVDGYSRLDDVRTALRTVYEHYQIPYADLKKHCQEMFEDEYNNIHYRNDVANGNWHPSELGHKAIAEVIQGTVEQYVKE